MGKKSKKPSKQEGGSGGGSGGGGAKKTMTGADASRVGIDGGRAKLVILDLDGLLVDSDRPMQQALAEFLPLTEEQIVTNVLGRAIPEAIVRLGVKKADHNKIQERHNELLLDAKPMPGAQRLMDHLESLGVPVAVICRQNHYTELMKDWHHRLLDKVRIPVIYRLFTIVPDTTLTH